jgi:hypothetical protein
MCKELGRVCVRSVNYVQPYRYQVNRPFLHTDTYTFDDELDKESNLIEWDIGEN